MKRIHLFEVEDFNWFPSMLRACMTNMIMVMHRLLGTSEDISEKLSELLKQTHSNNIIDLCSGSGGPMLDVLGELKNKYGISDVRLKLTDLYPDKEAVKAVGEMNAENISYESNPVDASNIPEGLSGVRTMICSFHHMKPEVARKILKSTMDQGQPIFIYEMSDNSHPSLLWWVAFPFNLISSLFVSLMTRPFTLQQFVFTYLIPILPICFAWDGAVSNARTYTLNDLDELLEGLESEGYKWEKGIIKRKGKKIWLSGAPTVK